MARRSGGLGKGLGALIPTDPQTAGTAERAEEAGLRELPTSTYYLYLVLYNVIYVVPLAYPFIVRSAAWDEPEHDW